MYLFVCHSAMLFIDFSAVFVVRCVHRMQVEIEDPLLDALYSI